MIRNIITPNGMVELWLDTFEWVFPLSFRYETVGNRKRPWLFSIAFLCFELIIRLSKDEE